MTTQLVLLRAGKPDLRNVRFVPPLVMFDGAEPILFVEDVPVERATRLAKAVASGAMAAEVAYDEMVYADQDYPGGCECELDLNCYLHRDRLYTAIELQMDAWAKQEVSPYPWDA